MIHTTKEKSMPQSMHQGKKYSRDSDPKEACIMLASLEKLENQLL